VGTVTPNGNESLQELEEPYRETHSVQFRWDVFNVPNLTRSMLSRRIVGAADSLAQQSTNFGAYTSLLTQPRVMQFALRYEF